MKKSMASWFRLNVTSKGLLYKKIAYVLWFVLSVFLFVNCLELFVPADEPIDIAYGEAALDFYRSCGEKDNFETLKVYNQTFPNQKYYGAGFEIVSTLIAELFPENWKFQIRHLLVSLCCSMIVFFTMYIVNEITSWKGAAISVLLFYASSIFLGYGLFNSKDIPFALGFVISYYYIIKYFKHYPRVVPKYLFGLGLGVGLAISVRIGGVLLIFYCLFFAITYVLFSKRKIRLRKEMFRHLALIGVACSFGLLLGLLWYPNFYKGPFDHVMDALNVASKFPSRILMVFEGRRIFSTDLPIYYLVKSIWISFPIIILLLAAVYIVQIVINIKNIGSHYYFFFPITAGFPIFWVTVNNIPVYNGWRHILFTFPSFIIIASIAALHLLKLRQPYLKAVIFTVLGILWIRPVFWNINNSLFQYTYYNEFVGGVNGAHYYYDIDHQQLGTSRALNWLLSVKSLNQKQNVDDVHAHKIVSNNGNALSYHPDLNRLDWNMNQTSFKSYLSNTWKCAILSPMFVPPKLNKLCYPPENSIHHIKIDDVVVAAVLNRETFEDYNGISHLQAGNYAIAVQLLKQSLSENPNDVQVKYWLGIGYYGTGKYKASIEALKTYEQFYPFEYQMLLFSGLSHKALREFDEAEVKLKKAIKIQPRNKDAYNALIVLYQNKGDNRKAEHIIKVMNQQLNK